MEGRAGWLLLVLLGTSACGAADDPADTGTAESEIGNNGSIDWNGDFSYVGALTAPGDGSMLRCSGTLVTRRWVLSARHCFIDPDRRSTPVQFVIGTDPGTASASRTFAKSDKKVAVRSTTPHDGEDDDEISRDIALVHLDRRVKPFIVQPKHPSMVAGSCGDEFDGRIVGYGGNIDECPDPDVPLHRRFAFVEDWTRSSHDHGTVYENDWGQALPFFCEDYNGAGPGDSGGALISSGGNLCGVISSGYGYYVAFGKVYLNKNPGVDSAETTAWLADRILDIDGNFEGECGPATAANDPDGDGIPGKCDSCPTVWNEEQLLAEDDPDDDGAGAACDFCPGVKAMAPGANCNVDIEMALAYPGATELPVLRKSDFSSESAFYDAREYMLASIRPDVCDPVPCPRASLAVGGDLPAGELPGLTQVEQLQCAAVGCSWRIENKIRISPQTSPPIASGPGGKANGTVGLRWCHCESPSLTFEQRVACQTGFQSDCKASEEEYSASQSWLKIVTKAAGGWSSAGSYGLGKDIGQAWSVPIKSTAATTNVTWDFLDLGPAYVEKDGKDRSVSGVLWSHFEDVDQSYAELPSSMLTKYGNVYGGGSASARFKEGTPPATFDVKWKYFCDECPFGVANVYAEIGNPGVYAVDLEGPVSLELSEATSAFFQQVAGGSLKHVPASEPPSWGKRNGTARLVGLGLETSGKVVRKLTATVGLPTVANLATGGGPVLRGNEGVALSAQEERLFVVGGTATGTDSGTPNTRAWIYTLANNTWMSVPMAAAERPGAVVAAAFMANDERVYFVERVGSGSGARLYLKTWAPLQKHPDGGAIESIARLPASWAAYSRWWVTVGEEGDLLVSGAGASVASRRSVFARFSFDQARNAKFEGLLFESLVVAAEPSMRRAEVAFTATIDGVPRHRTVLSAELKPASPVDTPTML